MLTLLEPSRLSLDHRASIVTPPTKKFSKGTAVIAVATKKRTVKSEPFTVKKGEKVAVGGVKFVVKAAGKPKWGDDALEIELQAKQPLTEIAAFVFTDAKGTKVASQSRGSSSFGIGKQITVAKTFNLRKKVDTCVLVLEMWVDKQDVKVPFDISVGIGG